MSPRKKAPVPVSLMTVRQISDEYGLPLRTAESYFGLVAREDGLIRLPGLRRVFVRREDVERRFQEAGASRCV